MRTKRSKSLPDLKDLFIALTQTDGAVRCPTTLESGPHLYPSNLLLVAWETELLWRPLVSSPQTSCWLLSASRMDAVVILDQSCWTSEPTMNVTHLTNGTTVISCRIGQRENALELRGDNLLDVIFIAGDGRTAAGFGVFTLSSAAMIPLSWFLLSFGLLFVVW